MNIRQMLEEYNDTIFKIELLRKKIIDAKAEPVTVGSMDYGRVKTQKNFFVESSLENNVIKNQDNIKDWQQQIESLCQEIKLIDMAIGILKDYNKSVIRMKYIERKTTRSIANYYDRNDNSIVQTIAKSIIEMQTTIDKFTK